MPSIPIVLTLLVIFFTLVAFIREWAPPDVLAMTILVILVPLGLVDAKEMVAVFKNEAPLTIAALFIIGGALERSGAVDQIGETLKNRLSGNTRVAILSFSLLTAFFSAWMNNTAIVAILLPVTLGFARSKDVPASRLLMPLSYSSILGGCCTLIGTSTNLLVNGALKDLLAKTPALKGHGVDPMSMFELAPVGIPLVVAGVGYMVIFGPKLIPARSSISGSLEIEARTTPLYHILVENGSTMVGKRLIETPLGDRSAGIHLMEIRRNGARLMLPLTSITVEENDRFLIALHRRKKTAPESAALFAEMGVKLLSTVEGIVTELVVRDESSLTGETLARSDFRQRYNSVVLAVHRNGVNITDKIAELPLDVGDTLLVITARNNLASLNDTRDFVMTDAPTELSAGTAKHHRPLHVWLSWGALVGVVLVATLTDVLHGIFPKVPEVPIHYAAMVGALLLMWLKVVSPREAYASIDWQVLLMLYGLLGLGMAMQNSGTAEFLATKTVMFAKQLVSPEHLPIVMLWALFILTLLLTEVLSNNATAVMMVPIAVTLAIQMGVSPRPYIMAATVAASTAFALPMGYQTHMMVYGPGGYRFTDFLKMGIPLNGIATIVSCIVIPMVWPF